MVCGKADGLGGEGVSGDQALSEEWWVYCLTPTVILNKGLRREERTEKKVIDTVLFLLMPRTVLQTLWTQYWGLFYLN